MVLAVLVLGLPKAQQQEGAAATAWSARSRSASIATLLAAYLIRLGWVKLVGAGYLLYLVYRHFGGRQAAATAHAAARRSRGWASAPFWATVVKVELTDIVFADRLDPRRRRDVAEALGDPDRRHPRHRHDAAGDRQAAGAGRALSGAGRRRVRHHRVGRAQAADRVRARRGLHRVRDPEVASRSASSSSIFGVALVYALSQERRDRARHADSAARRGDAH